MTPLQAIRKQCVECVGGPQDVKDCGGHAMYGDQGDENNVCWFYPYRMGKGRPSVKTIRKFCLECMGGSHKLVEGCADPGCPLYAFRFGTNPNISPERANNLSKKKGVHGSFIFTDELLEVG